MTLKYVLSGNTILKNINLFLTIDNINFKFHTLLRIPQEDWDTEKQRPKNIYLKKHKKINCKLDILKKELALYVHKKSEEKKDNQSENPFKDVT